MRHLKRMVREEEEKKIILFIYLFKFTGNITRIKCHQFRGVLRSDADHIEWHNNDDNENTDRLNKENTVNFA